MKRNERRLLFLALLLPLFISLTLAVPIANATSEVIDSAIKSGKKLKVAVVMYKDVGEIDSRNDYYSIKVTIEDIYSKNDPWVNPVYADIWVNLPRQAQEVPSNHKPRAGFYLQQSQISFNYMGIRYNVFRPALFISYNEFSNGPSHRGFHWHVAGAQGPFFLGWIFFDYSEFSIGIRVPQGFKPDVDVDAFCVWYRSYIAFYLKDSKEYVYNVNVDPIGASPLPPYYPRVNYKPPKKLQKRGRP